MIQKESENIYFGELKNIFIIVNIYIINVFILYCFYSLAYLATLWYKIFLKE